MKKRLILLLLLLPLSTAFAEPLDLDRLLREVKESQGAEGKFNREREARFLAEKNKQQELLNQARAKLKISDQTSRDLKATLEANEAELAALEEQLKQRSGVLGELFGVARQAAGDLRAELDSSLISAQFPDRSPQLDQIANNKALPTLDQIESLWFTLLQEMTESGKVVKFRTEIMSASGEPRKALVIRVGAQNAVADGRYLHYIAETGRLAELARQPDAKYLELAEDLGGASSDSIDFGVDPTRGVVLGMLMQVPNTFERIDQGGVIGYIIIALGVIGLGIVILRLSMLRRMGQKMKIQLDDLTNCREDNPLGRVLAVARNCPKDNFENLELRIDEAVIREVPQIERGQSLIKLLIAVAPLLGLLGTVTGMIQVFQSITLFGSGDPKLMAGGIAEALVTTMLGLMVAIPLSFLYSLMAAQSRTLVQVLDEQSAGLLSRVLENKVP